MKIIPLLFLVTSCALFKSEPNLLKEDKKELLSSIKLVGEGKGRIALGESNYVFGVDSFLKENSDWVLAVQIPLQGEEALILPNLKQKKQPQHEIESFEERIAHEFKKRKLDRSVSPKVFIKEMRSLVRFVLAPEWGEKHNCEERQDEMLCTLDGEKFPILVEEKEISIIRPLGEKKFLVLSGRNLTKSIFAQTDIRLYTNGMDRKKKNSSFSLELFW